VKIITYKKIAKKGKSRNGNGKEKHKTKLIAEKEKKP
jgi:hypothetical protein